VTQTIGLQTTEAGKAAFITGLSVVLVPVFAAWFLHQPSSRNAVAGILLATVGLALMTLDRS
jgi:drug/metabolite transporter (DMT)-like permease